MNEKIFYKLVDNKKIACLFTQSDVNSTKVVIMAHGFRDSMVDASRRFVLLSRELAAKGICSLRFDQYGTGNSAGDFYDSSFNDWINTIQNFVKEYLEKGFQIGLFGNSMGATAVMNAVGNENIREKIDSIALWVPDPKLDKHPLDSEYMEEGGQRVQIYFWKEAYSHDFIANMNTYEKPLFILYGEKDKYISQSAREAVIKKINSKKQSVVILKGEDHSEWSFNSNGKAVNDTVDFFQNSLK